MQPTLSFEVIHEYDPGEPGITLPVELKLAEKSLRISAKLDCGSSFCIFKREHGEELGLIIESGTLERISTAMGSFVAYGHPVTLSALGFELEVVAYFAAMPNFPRNVLGRHGWMQQLKLGIVDYDGRLYVGRYDSEA